MPLCREDLNRALEIDAGNSEVKKELEAIKQKEKQAKQKQQNLYKKMLFGN